MADTIKSKLTPEVERAPLLPCPFCGETPRIGAREDEDLWTHNTVTWTGVHCSNCDVGFDRPPGAEPDAIAQWNCRAPHSRPGQSDPSQEETSMTIPGREHAEVPLLTAEMAQHIMRTDQEMGFKPCKYMQAIADGRAVVVPALIFPESQPC